LLICGKVNEAETEQRRVRNINNTESEKLELQTEDISMGLRCCKCKT